MQINRRKILKGSLAVPLMLTVQSSGAVPRASGGACLARDARRAYSGSSKPVELSSTNLDDWMRARVNICELRQVQGPGEMKSIEGKYFLGADRVHYWQVEEDRSGHKSARRTNYTVHNAVARQTGEVQHALVTVDSEAKPTGYSFEGRGGNPVTQSCWSSFRLAAQQSWWDR